MFATARKGQMAIWIEVHACPKKKNAQSEEFIVLQTRRSEKIVYIKLLLLSLSLSCVRHVFKCVNENASDWTTGYIA